MRNKIAMIVSGVGILMTAALLIGAEPASRTPAQWEYAMYVESLGNFEWHGAVTHVRATTANFFFERMGFPSDIEVSARTGRIQPVLFNHLGRQGWELIETIREPSREIFWFKRPR